MEGLGRNKLFQIAETTLDPMGSRNSLSPLREAADEYGTFINQVFIRRGLPVYESVLNIVSIFSIKNR